MAAKKVNGMSAADFIRSMPDAKPKDIVLAAKKAGHTFNDKYVSRIRYMDKASTAKGTAGRKPGRPAKAAGRPAASGNHARAAVASVARDGSGTEATFRRAILEIGVPRAKSLVADVERRLAEIIG